VVLSAFGCGAYKNPAEHIALLFKETLQEERWKGCFKLIVFAILLDHNSYSHVNPEGNLQPFISTFSGLDQGFVLFPERDRNLLSEKDNNNSGNNKDNNSKDANSYFTPIIIDKPIQKLKIIVPPSNDTTIYFHYHTEPFGFLCPKFKSVMIFDETKYSSVEDYLNKTILNDFGPEKKFSILQKANVVKFSDREMKKLLNETVGKELIYISHDDLFGKFENVGQNMLGDILMKIRDSKPDSFNEIEIEK